MDPAPAPAIPPRPASGGGFLWTFDPAGFTDTDGQRYVYFGSYFGGLWATRMSADGLTPVGAATQVAIDNRYEGSYVVRHGDFYYLMGSAANCCAGPTTGYSVFAGRSRSPLGPFLDAEGTPLLTSRVGGTTVLTQNGNRFVGAGHHAVVTDAQGRDFIAYHAIDRTNPWLTTTFGINRRPMLLDLLDWVDGWPRTRAGAGPSDTPQPAPSLESGLGITPTDPLASGFTGLADGTGGPRHRQHGARPRHRLDDGVRPRRAAPRASRPPRHRAAPCSARARPRRQGHPGPQGWPPHGPGRRDGTVRSSTTALPALPAGAWRTLTVEATADGLTAEVTESDLADVAAPGARVRRRPCPPRPRCA